jgi:hypothetical protein
MKTDVLMRMGNMPRPRRRDDSTSVGVAAREPTMSGDDARFRF